MAPQRDLAVLVVTSGWPTPERPESSVFVAQEVDAVREAGVQVGVVTYDGRMNPLNYLRARRQVRRAVASKQYDVIHAHFGQSGLAALATGVPVVVTFHGSDLLGVVGRSGRYSVKGWLLRIVSRAAAKRADRVIIVGRRLAAHLPDGVRSDVIPAGVDLTVFVSGDKERARTTLRLSRDRKYVLFSGSPSVTRKRYDLAVETIRRVRDEFDVELLVVEGKSRSEVAKRMQACDALLVTALHESGPLTVKEALACDLPVVSVDVGDVAEIIADLEGCVLCADDDPETIAEALRRVLRSTAHFEGRHAAEPFSQERLTERQLEIYADLAGKDSSVGA